MFSSSTDVAPNTPTFTLYKANYTSTHLAFTGYEVEDRNKKPLMTLPTDIGALVSTLQPEPELPVHGHRQQGLHRDVRVRPERSRGHLDAGGDRARAHRPVEPGTQAIITTANYVSAGLRATAKNPPASVCTSAGVKAAATALKLKL